MAKKRQEGEVNRSQAIRDLIKVNPKIKAGEAVQALAQKGIEVRAGLFYIVKGKMAGRKRRRRKNQETAVSMISADGAAKKSDALATIRKIKELAVDVGGMRTLKGLVNALSE